MSTTTTTNGRTRKSLADQIDRLDAILDGLAENLNDAVAMAAASSMKEVFAAAVQEAVRAALLEILANADVHQRLTASQAPNVPAPAPGTARLTAQARSCWNWLVGTAQGAWSRIVALVHKAGGGAKARARSLLAAAGAEARQVRERVVRRVRVGWKLVTLLAGLAQRYRAQVLVAVGVGLLTGMACYLGGREIASLGCGLAGFLGSLAAEVVSRFRRLRPPLLGTES